MSYYSPLPSPPPPPTTTHPPTLSPTLPLTQPTSTPLHLPLSHPPSHPPPLTYHCHTHPGALFRSHSLTETGRRRLVHMGLIEHIADGLRAVGSTAVALGRQKAAWPQGQPPAAVDTVIAKLSQVGIGGVC